MQVWSTKKSPGAFSGRRSGRAARGVTIPRRREASGRFSPDVETNAERATRDMAAGPARVDVTVSRILVSHIPFVRGRDDKLMMSFRKRPPRSSPGFKLGARRDADLATPGRRTRRERPFGPSGRWRSARSRRFSVLPRRPRRSRTPPTRTNSGRLPPSRSARPRTRSGARPRRARRSAQASPRPASLHQGCGRDSRPRHHRRAPRPGRSSATSTVASTSPQRGRRGARDNLTNPSPDVGVGPAAKFHVIAGTRGLVAVASPAPSSARMVWWRARTSTRLRRLASACLRCESLPPLGSGPTRRRASAPAPPARAFRRRARRPPRRPPSPRRRREARARRPKPEEESSFFALAVRRPAGVVSALLLDRVSGPPDGQ